MATTQPKMTEVTNKNGSAFVASAPSLEGEEPEVNSINFRESLRFFQEQLLINTKKQASNGNSLKSVLRVNSNLSSTESLDIQKCTDISDEETITYTSSKIPPIPTVDTILESVRILRAIQKSQAQRGSHFGIDVISSNSDAFDSYKALELEFQKGLIEVDSLSALINGSEYSNEAAVEYKGEAEDGISTPLCCQESEDVSDNTDLLENAQKGYSGLQSEKAVKSSVVQKASDLETRSSIVQLPVVNSQHDRNFHRNDDYTDVSNNISYDLDISEGILSKIDATNQEVVADISKKLQRNNIDEEGVEDFLSCSSLTLQEDVGETKLDLPTSERSTSAEFDSGMCTDKSVGSLSPIRCEADPEKDLWSESSQYASAEGSPCESLVGIPEEQELSNHGMADILVVKDKLDTKVTYDSDACGQEKESTVVSNEDHDSPLNKENVSVCETSSYNISPLQVSCNTDVSESRHDTHQGDYHVSKDRLIEIMEGKLEQLELERVKNSADIDISLDVTEQVCPDNSTKDDLGANAGNTTLTEDRINFCDSTIPGQLENEGKNIEEDKKNEATKQPDTGSCISHDTFHPVSVSDDPEEAIHNCSAAASVEESVCVSSLECTLSSSELSVNNLETVRDCDGDDEPQPPKKKLTISWDPIPLLEHMYDIKQHFISEGQKECGPHTEDYMDVEPFGAFDDKGGTFYTITEENYLYFYESERKEKLLLKVPLQYATIETIDKNALLLDNKLGRWIRIKFSDEQKMLETKAILQSHCKNVQSSTYLEPVNYPLRSHKDVIIIDLGSCSTRAGILMDQPTLPKLFFPTVCATDKKTGIQNYGIKALLPEVRKNSVLSFPVRPSAKVTKFTMDIDALAGLFKNIFSDLKVEPRNYTVQLCIPRSLSTNTQIALMKLLLEDFGVQSVSLTRQALLTLYANNTSTAIVVDIGDRMEVLPVVDGFILEGGVSRLPYGGQRIIHHMKHALAQKHISLSNDVESFVVQYIFESLCYVAEDYEEELANAMSHPETTRKCIPLHPFFKDDTKLQTVWLDVGRFQVPEGLFQPDLWGLDSPGLHKLVHQAIQTSSMDVRRQIAENIYVSGGVTLLPGFVERLQKEVAKLTLPRLKPKVHASPFRYHMTYIGACQLASSEAFHQVCISANEWIRNGPSSLNKWHL